MRRREFIALTGGAVLGWPISTRAQQGERMRRVGVLMGYSAEAPQAGPFLTEFKNALMELGWIEGRNIQIDYRWAATDTDLMRTFAKELIDLKPDVIVGHRTPVVAALHRETSTIPIVFVTVSDPVGSRFVASLARPGGNITGFINLESSLGGKWIELLKEVAPGITRVGLLFNPQTAPQADYYRQPFEVAARSVGIDPFAAVVRSGEDIEPVVAAMAGGSTVGLAVMPDIFTSEQKDLIISAVARHRVPTVFPYRYMAAAGGLISYGIDLGDLWRRTPSYVDRLLKGEKAADLPIQQPTKFELAINLMTAKALDLTVPLSLLARADEVIE
jgi:putative tryptophan/tyrosine transport system substrate-binding protein